MPSRRKGSVLVLPDGAEDLLRGGEFTRVVSARDSRTKVRSAVELLEYRMCTGDPQVKDDQELVRFSRALLLSDVVIITEDLKSVLADRVQRMMDRG